MCYFLIRQKCFKYSCCSGHGELSSSIGALLGMQVSFYFFMMIRTDRRRMKVVLMCLTVEGAGFCHTEQSVIHNCSYHPPSITHGRALLPHTQSVRIGPVPGTRPIIFSPQRLDRLPPKAKRECCEHIPYRPGNPDPCQSRQSSLLNMLSPVIIQYIIISTPPGRGRRLDSLPLSSPIIYDKQRKGKPPHIN